MTVFQNVTIFSPYVKSPKLIYARVHQGCLKVVVVERIFFYLNLIVKKKENRVSINTSIKRSKRLKIGWAFYYKYENHQKKFLKITFFPHSWIISTQLPASWKDTNEKSKYVEKGDRRNILDPPRGEDRSSFETQAPINLKASHSHRWFQERGAYFPSFTEGSIERKIYSRNAEIGAATKSAGLRNKTFLQRDKFITKITAIERRGREGGAGGGKVEQGLREI